jgi:hypothetical protein
MILDSQLIFEEAMEIPDASTVDAADHIDLQAAGVGGSGQLFFNAIVETAGAGGTSCAAVLYDSADDSAFTVVMQSGSVALASLTSGAVLISASIPPGVRRYLKAALTGAGTFTAGTVNLFLTIAPIKAL